MKVLWKTSCLVIKNGIQYRCGINDTLGNVLFVKIINFPYICKGYTYEMIKASLVHKGAFIRSIIVRSISIYNNDFDELIRPVILLLLENLKKDK